MAQYVNRTYLQFQQATNLNNLLDELAPYLTIDEEAFYQDYFDITTCNGFGLDNWGRLLDFSRFVIVANLDNCFGFDTGIPAGNDTDYPQNFGQGNFWGGQTDTIVLSDELYRTVLRFRYAVLTTNASLGAANNILNTYFQSIDPSKKVIVSQTGTMQITFTFNFYLDDSPVLLVRELLPVPLGVEYTIIQGAIF